MIYETINLKDFYPKLQYDVKLIAYCMDTSPEISLERRKQTILCIPGGGYNHVSFREDEPIALRFLGYDINVFVLRYSVNPNTFYPYPLIEAIAALDYIHKNAEKYHVDEDKISLLGFSAGGHLAASLAAYRNEETYKKYLGVSDLKSDIYSLILGYPVITCDPSFTHHGTADNVTKSDPEKLVDYFSIEKHVTKDFPRTFIYSFEEDPVVPIQNTYVLVDALKNNGIEVEYHIYHAPNHGSSLGDRSVYNDSIDISLISACKDWPLLAIDFLRRK